MINRDFFPINMGLNQTEAQSCRGAEVGMIWGWWVAPWKIFTAGSPTAITLWISKGKWWKELEKLHDEMWKSR